MNLKEIRPIGEGHFCIVKKFIDTESDEEYAKKELLKKHYENEDYRYRLLREINLLKELSGCEHIIELVDFEHDSTKQKLWYLMRCANDNLYNFIKTHNNKLSKEDRFEITEQIINAIKFAHDKDILHRDLSPNNVLIFRKDNQVLIKVSDFGLGKNEESLSHYTKSSVSGYGQILYVSPEQKEKLNEATKKSDIYSLGKLIYFIFTGKDPVEIKSSFDLHSIVIKAISDDRYKSIDELKEHFNSLKNLILNKDIPFQYLSINDFLGRDNNIDWGIFYEIATKGNYKGHVYKAIIEPIISLFKGKSVFEETSNIQDFCKFIGKDRFINFIKFFSHELSLCYQSTGWPFEATTGFGVFFRYVFGRIDIDEVKLVCLKNLWYLAYVSDRWDVQRQLNLLLKSHEIPDSIQAQFGDYIAQTRVSVDMNEFEGIKLPISVKLGIIEANEFASDKKIKKAAKENDFEF